LLLARLAIADFPGKKVSWSISENRRLHL